jgi:hypothetical protein
MFTHIYSGGSTLENTFHRQFFYATKKKASNLLAFRRCVESLL